jgi:CheY-like chemotaxis protein
MNRKILVVEDNALNMKLMRGIFKLGQYEIVEAPDAETGIGLARKERPFLILMDIQLPGMDGLQATRIIKSEPDIRDIPVIALTGFAMPTDHKMAMEAGCDDTITKPVDVNQVLELISKYSDGNGNGSGNGDGT